MVLVLEYLEYYSDDKKGNKIKEDVSEWGEFELFECKISNIKETQEFSDQLEHFKKRLNKKWYGWFCYNLMIIVNLTNLDFFMKNSGNQKYHWSQSMTPDYPENSEIAGGGY